MKLTYRSRLAPLLVGAIGVSVVCPLAGLNSTFPSPGHQEAYYYSGGERISLNPSVRYIAICFEETVTKESRRRLIQENGQLAGIHDERAPSEPVVVELSGAPEITDVAKILGDLQKLPEVKYSAPVFEWRQSKTILTDELIVQFVTSVTEEEIRSLNAANETRIIEEYPYGHNCFLLRILDPNEHNALEVANRYYESPRVRYSHPNFLYLGIYQTTPNDPCFAQQWPLHNTGQDPPGGTADADMDAPEGWDTSTGSSSIVIAVLDSGVDIDHNDLAAKTWVNEAELNGDPDVDDDDNGYVDDIYGWDFADGNNDPRPDPYESEAHGTMCAGLAAAATDSSEGIAGVCWAAKIMPLQIGSFWHPLSASRAKKGIDYARVNGADVLSISWSGGSGIVPDAVKEAITNAKMNGRNGRGCVLVCASGDNPEAPPQLPARLGSTIAVGATDPNDARWANSNYGNELDVVAPCGWGPLADDVVICWSTDISGDVGYNPGGDGSKGDVEGDYYKYAAGTSAAAPEVAGLAALVLSVDSNLTADEVRLIITSTADDVDAEGWDPNTGWGRVNIDAALSAASSYQPPAQVFCVKDSSGDRVAWLDLEGNLFLTGSMVHHYDWTDPSPVKDEFIVKNSSDVPMAYISETGDMYRKGPFEENSSQTGTGNDEFRVQNSSGADLMIVDTTNGNVYIKGDLYESANP